MRREREEEREYREGTDCRWVSMGEVRAECLKKERRKKKRRQNGKSGYRDVPSAYVQSGNKSKTRPSLLSPGPLRP